MNTNSNATYILITGTLSLLILASSLVWSNVLAYPSAKVIPSCGPVEGFGVSIIANGFKPNRTVDWQIVNSKGDVPLFGYFNSNMSGGFNETTYADDLTKGRYKMYFGTDSNNDNIMDTNVTRIYVNLTLPCEE